MMLLQRRDGEKLKGLWVESTLFLMLLYDLISLVFHVPTEHDSTNLKLN